MKNGIFRRGLAKTVTTVLLLLPIIFWSNQGLAEDSVKSLSKAGKYEEAYQLGQKQLVKNAGSPSFDYWFGIAALKTDHASEATFAFERVLMFDPNNHAALLRLGQAQAAMGQQLRVKQTMTDLLTRRPSKSIVRQARKALGDVKNRGAGKRDKNYTAAYVELSAGSDSNVNSATDIEFHQLVGVILQLAGTALEASDSFSRLAMGISTKRTNSSIFWFGGINGYENRNSKYTTFNTRSIKTYGGVGFRSGKNRFSFPLRYQTVTLGGNSYMSYVAGQAKWLRYVGNRYAFGASLELGQYTYDILDRDSSNTVVDFSMYRYATKRSRTKMSLGIYAGNESVDNPANDYLSHSFAGVVFGANYRFGKNHTPYVNLRFQKNDYEGIPTGFTEARDETYVYAHLGWKWKMRKDATINIEGIYTNNDSNLDLYAYDRTQIMMGLRYTYR